MMNKPSFSEFLQFFPEFKLPISITENSIRVFSDENDPLPIALSLYYLKELEIDEFTEVIPAVSINTGFAFYSIIVWELKLLNYQCYLFTFDSNGERIDSRVIAHVQVEKGDLTHQVAMISEDLTVYQLRSKENKADMLFREEDMEKGLFEITEEGRLIDL